MIKKVFSKHWMTAWVLAILMLPVTLASCKKETGEKVELTMADPAKVVIAPDEYANRIKDQTDFIAGITSNETFELHPGVKETHVKLVNTSGSPLSLYFFTVDLSHPDVSMEVATPNEQPAFALQTVRTQAIRKNTTLENRGEQKHVIAAVNGDYWDVSGNPGIASGTPLGPVVKNRTVVKDTFHTTAAYYFLSIQANKRAVIGDRSLFAKLSNMKETLGGRYLLVYNGIDRTASLNTNVEPRTTVGLVNMNKLIFMVVDGRRPEHSVGIAMAGLAKIFMAIGAKDVINLDGGGSSTFVSYNKATNDLEVRNKPSDNSPRNVANSWTIIGKK